MNKLMIMSGIAVFATMAASAASITNVLIRQQWPWSGKVNVDYVLKDADDGKYNVKVTFRDGSRVIENQVVSGDLFDVGPGEHRIVWDPTYGRATAGQKVLPDVTATVSATPADNSKLFMVVDLSTTDENGKFPVEFLDAPPSGGWNQELYKTTKMPFRRIRATTFRMGTTAAEREHFGIDGSWAVRQSRAVTLTKDYYIAIFETTVKQSLMMTGGGDAPGLNLSPARNVTYGDIRGNSANVNWPNYEAGSRLDVLNGKLSAVATAAFPGYKFELPTYAQWELACRGGVDTCYNSGKNWSSDGTAEIDWNLYDLAWYVQNGAAYDMWNPVGLKLPNAIGLYDMHGGVMELIRDTMSTASDCGAADPLVDPVLRDTTGDYGVWACGGGTRSPAKDCICNGVVRLESPTLNGTAGEGLVDPRYHTGYRLVFAYVGD